MNIDLHELKSEVLTGAGIEYFNNNSNYEFNIFPFLNYYVNYDNNNESISGYGLRDNHYVIRNDDTYRIINTVKHPILDYKLLKNEDYISYKQDFFLLPPHQTILLKSYEKIVLDQYTHALLIGKEIYHQLGLNIFSKPIESNHNGNIDIYVTNQSSNPIKLYSFEGIANLYFFKEDKKQ